MLFLRYVGTCNVFPGRVRQQVFAHISVYLAYVTRRGWSRRVPSKGTFALDHVSIVTLLFSFFWSIFLRPLRFLIIWNQINPRKRSIPIRINFHIYSNCRVRLRIIILSNTMRDFIFYVNLRHIVRIMIYYTSVDSIWRVQYENSKRTTFRRFKKFVFESKILKIIYIIAEFYMNLSTLWKVD